LKTDFPPVRTPLVIDLDGTLTYSDLLWESFVLFLKHRLSRIWLLPVWLCGGKARLKEGLAGGEEFDARALPYDKDLIAYIRQQRAMGRPIVLATGAQRRLADKVAAHLQLFDVVLATEHGVNLTSGRKAEALIRHYGRGGFDYVGNSRVDIPVWEACRTPFSVAARTFRLADGRIPARIGGARHAWLPALWQALRPRQWLKNLLVFVPVLAGHRFTAEALAGSLVAFAAFSLCASSAYLLNDVLDVHDDRLHATKHTRPIATGRLPIAAAIGAFPLLAGAAFLLCGLANPLLLAAVGVYYATTVWYSLHLKRIMMLDIVVLALLYCIRIVGGAAASLVPPSFWLIGFSFFLFFSLALLKRFSELGNLRRRGGRRARGRGYQTADATPIGAMGINAAFVSVLILMLYMNSENALQHYRYPVLLYLWLPLLAFWLGRVWLLAYRGKVNEDPVHYVSRDRISLAVFAACGSLGVAATVLP
jgi:4-hydroxybenzoate polyprenyltransferase